MGTIVESQILKENKKCHILHFRTDKEWHRRSALLEIVLNNSETQMKTVPGAKKIMAQVSVCSLHFYIIWFQYSFCFTFYSVFKPSFFFFFVVILPQAWHLIPFPASSASQPFTSSRGTTVLILHSSRIACGLHSFLCREHSSPISWCGRFLFVIQILTQVSTPQKSWSWPPVAAQQLKFCFSLLHLSLYLPLFILIYLSVCSLSTLKCNLNEKRDLVSYVTLHLKS